jgi:hypothetical protein
MAKKPYKDEVKTTANIMISPELKLLGHAEAKKLGLRGFSTLVEIVLTDYFKNTAV